MFVDEEVTRPLLITMAVFEKKAVMSSDAGPGVHAALIAPFVPHVPHELSIRLESPRERKQPRLSDHRRDYLVP